MDSEPEDQYVVIIVECCENCDTHQAVTRHSEWKYYEQFNECTTFHYPSQEEDREVCP